MKKLLLAILLAAPVPCLAQEQQRVAIDTSAARILVEAWQRQPKDSLGCLIGNVNGDVIEIASARIDAMCGDGDIGVVQFLKGEHEAEREAVLAGMHRVLAAQPDLWIAGAVYGWVPVQYEGKMHRSPRVWAAVRRVEKGKSV